MSSSMSILLVSFFAECWKDEDSMLFEGPESEGGRYRLLMISVRISIEDTAEAYWSESSTPPKQSP